MLAFDTLKYANVLKHAGIPTEQAEAQAEALAEALSESVVTKSDFRELKNEITYRFESIDRRFEGIDKRFAQVETRLDTLVNALKWGAGLSLTYLTLVMTLMQFFKH